MLPSGKRIRPLARGIIDPSGVSHPPTEFLCCRLCSALTGVKVKSPINKLRPTMPIPTLTAKCWRILFIRSPLYLPALKRTHYVGRPLGSSAASMSYHRVQRKLEVIVRSTMPLHFEMRPVAWLLTTCRPICRTAKACLRRSLNLFCQDGGGSKYGFRSPSQSRS
jgi:hypothetical protein